MSETTAASPSGPSRNVLLIALVGIVGLVVLGLLAFWALGGADDTADTAGTAQAPSSTGTTEQETELEPAPAGDGLGDPGLSDVVTVTYDVYLARDPFDPVVPEPEPAADAAPADGAPQPVEGVSPTPVGPDDPNGPTQPDDPAQPGEPTAPAPGTPTQPGEPGEPGQPSQPGQPGSGACRGTDELVCGGQVVTLLEVAGGRARIQVDDVVYEVAPGDSFGTRFRLVAIGDANCVDVQYADDVRRICARTLK